MITPCPYFDCENRTEFGYCKTTACINPIHSNIGTAQYGKGVQRNIITNADRIRAMTDEELANFMMHFSDYVPEPNGGTPEQCWLNWLKQEADNG